MSNSTTGLTNTETALVRAQNEVAQLEASLIQKQTALISSQTELTLAEQTKITADTEVALATNVLQLAQRTKVILRQVLLTNEILNFFTLYNSGISRTNIINSIQESYNRIIDKNLSYDLTNNIIKQYQSILLDEVRKMGWFNPPGGANNPFSRNFIEIYHRGVMTSLNKISNDLTQILSTATNQQQNFSNTTILESFWNDVETRTESVQNAIAINSNILPIGINTSNNMSMYASVVY